MVYRDTFKVREHMNAAKIIKTIFELHLINIAVDKRTITLANLYRPPSMNLNIFLDELAYFLSATVDSLAMNRMLLCGNFNCPGTNGNTVDVSLCSLLDTHGLEQHVDEATRSASSCSNLLHLIITVASSTLLYEVVNCARISDHLLIGCKL